MIRIDLRATENAPISILWFVSIRLSGPDATTRMKYGVTGLPLRGGDSPLLSLQVPRRWQSASLQPRR